MVSMCSDLSNFVTLLRILRIVVPITLITFGLVLLYDRKKFYSEVNFKKFSKKMIIMMIIAVGFVLLSSIVIWILGPTGVCEGRFIDVGHIWDDLVYYTHFATYLIIIIFTNFILYIILSSLSKKMNGKKRIFITKLIEVTFVFLVLIIYCFINNEFESQSKRGRSDRHSTTWKPIMYIYPKEEMNLNIEFPESEKLMHTYPKYKDSWSIHVDKNGNIYDYDTNRNYYALYWDEKDYAKENFDEGFVVKGEDISKFLEEKLAILGFNDREINEFIIYWMPKMEDNKYNLIRFRTTYEVNESMPIEFSKEPDTLIRVIMDYKKLDKKIEIKEQQLVKQERVGFTIVEWGGRELD